MNIKKLSPRLFVSGQLSVSDIAAVAAQGIKTIFCNRPDQEEQGQPASNEVAAAAEAEGISFEYLPVVAGSMTSDNIEEFGRAYRDVQGPILAYCRTGTRSTSLWALTEATSLEADAILSAAAEAGYDLSAMRNRLLDVSAAASSGDAASTNSRAD